jgi:hypothetical protein
MARSARTIAAAPTDAHPNVVARVIRPLDRGIHALGRATLRLLYRLDLVPHVPEEDAIFVVLLGGRLDGATPTDEDARAIEASFADRAASTAQADEAQGRRVVA